MKAKLLRGSWQVNYSSDDIPRLSGERENVKKSHVLGGCCIKTKKEAQEKKIKTKGIYSSTKYSLRDATINYAYKVTPKNTENSTHMEKGIESTTREN